MRSGELLPVIIVDTRYFKHNPRPGDARLTLYRTGLLRAFTECVDGSHKVQSVYTFREPAVRQPSSRTSLAAGPNPGRMTSAYDSSGASTRYLCYVLDNGRLATWPQYVSDQTALMLVNVRNAMETAWIYGPMRPWWVEVSHDDFLRRTPDLTGFLALARDVVTDADPWNGCGGYCDVYY